MAYTTIDNPSEHFQPVIWTGNGTDDRAINIGMQPDFVWWKHRTSTSYWHYLVDSSRGIGKQLYSNGNNAEDTHAGGHVKSYTSTGITLDDDQAINHPSTTYVSWMWKANGGSTTNQTGSDIDSVTQVNSTAKFGIMTYTGAANADSDTDNNSGAFWRIKHGLGSVPKWLIVKNRGTAGWYQWHHKFDGASTTDGDHIYWPGNPAMASESGNILWGNTAWSSTEIEVGAWNVVNRDSQTFIAYYWDEVQGFSKFGSYTGNNNADGVFIYTGFKPAFFMWKRTDHTAGWGMIDSARDPFNEGFKQLGPDDADGDGDYAIGDFLSNGIKMRNTFADTNSVNHYIYMAFAEHPFVSSEGVPVTAR